MKLVFGSETPTEKKPETSLEEKVGGFKFTLPQSKPQETSKAETPTSTSSDKAVEKKPLVIGSAPANGNGNEVQGAKGSAERETPKPVEKTNAVPDVSDERFNLIDGTEAELSEAAAEQFKEMIAMLSDCVDGDEHSLQNVLKATLEHLAENPDLNAILSPEDRSVFVRAARQSYGITLVAKTARKTKTKKADAKVDELMDELADLDFAL